jgi:hypothetical protein
MQGLSGLYSRYRGRKGTAKTPALEARILNWTRRKPTEGSAHCSSRRLAKALGINRMMVARVLARAGLKPHRVERYVASNDPEFGSEPADIVRLYVNPPQHAAAFCIERDVIARGISTSMKDLSRKLMRYIRLYNRKPKPINRICQNTEHRIQFDANSRFTGHSVPSSHSGGGQRLRSSSWRAVPWKAPSGRKERNSTFGLENWVDLLVLWIFFPLVTGVLLLIAPRKPNRPRKPPGGQGAVILGPAFGLRHEGRA